MAYVADVAMTLINMSIEEAERSGDERFYMNFIKTRELLFIASCLFTVEYGDKNTLFQEEIVSRPNKYHYIGGTSFVARMKGFGPIKEKFGKEYVVRPSYRRIKILEKTLHEYGLYNETELLSMIEKKEIPLT